MAENYSLMNIGTFEHDLAKKGRVMAGQELGATGSEISFNYTPAGQFVPFVHSHKQNEEIYIIVRGNGEFKVDDKEFAIQEGSVIRVAPAAQRAIKAGTEDLIYICIQAQSNSLAQATEDDGVLSEAKASWMKD